MLAVTVCFLSRLNMNVLYSVYAVRYYPPVKYTTVTVQKVVKTYAPRLITGGSRLGGMGPLLPGRAAEAVGLGLAANSPTKGSLKYPSAAAASFPEAASLAVACTLSSLPTSIVPLLPPPLPLAILLLAIALSIATALRTNISVGLGSKDVFFIVTLDHTIPVRSRCFMTKWISASPHTVHRSAQNKSAGVTFWGFLGVYYSYSQTNPPTVSSTAAVWFIVHDDTMQYAWCYKNIAPLC